MRRFAAAGSATRATGALELSLYGGEYATVVAAGVCAAIPVTTWLTMIVAPLDIDRPVATHEPWSAVAVVCSVIGALLSMLVAPWLVPLLVLRARQPKGARIVWDAKGITEWDGPWKRTVIAWGQLEAAHLTWVTKTRSGSVITDDALQLVGPAPSNAITVWTSPPKGAPSLRRRLCSKRVAELREAIVARGVAVSGSPDWRRAADPDRPPHRALSIVGRLGYPFAVFAPLLVPISPIAGVLFGAVSAVLLGFRAVPVFRELQAVRARRRAPAPARDAPHDEPRPYRAAQGEPPSEPEPSDDGRCAADALKLRAVRVEVIVRAGCVAMVAASTALGFSLR